MARVDTADGKINKTIILAVSSTNQGNHLALLKLTYEIKINKKKKRSGVRQPPSFIWSQQTHSDTKSNSMWEYLPILGISVLKMVFSDSVALQH